MMNKIYIITILVVSLAFLIYPFIFYHDSIIMVITSDSMFPVLNPYDLIIVERTNIEQIRVGDIITFNTHMEELGIVAHRTVELFDDHGEIGIHTRGDNVESVDPWVVHDEDLIGRVMNIVPKMGILLINPVRYAIVSVIIITAISLMWSSYYKDRNTKIQTQ